MEKNTKSVKAYVSHGFIVVYYENGQWYSIDYDTECVNNINDSIERNEDIKYIFMAYKEHSIKGMPLNLN